MTIRKTQSRGWRKLAAALLIGTVASSVVVTTIYVSSASAGSLLGAITPSKKKKKKGALGGLGAVGGALGAVGAAGAAGLTPEMAGIFAGIASGDPAALKAFQGQVFAAVLKGVTDEIEQKNARKSLNSALQSGKSTKESFKNSKGEEVTVTTEVKEVKKEGTTCRELSTSVERDGKKAEDAGGSKEICQMKLADGTVGYPPME